MDELDDLIDGSHDQESSASRPWMASPAMLVLATGLIALGGLALVPDGFGFHIAGYLVTAGLGFTSVAIYRRGIVLASSTTSFVPPGWVKHYSNALIVAGLVVTAVHAWFFARHFA